MEPCWPLVPPRRPTHRKPNTRRLRSWLAWPSQGDETSRMFIVQGFIHGDWTDWREHVEEDCGQVGEDRKPSRPLIQKASLTSSSLSISSGTWGPWCGVACARGNFPRPHCHSPRIPSCNRYSAFCSGRQRFLKLSMRFQPDSVMSTFVPDTSLIRRNVCRLLIKHFSRCTSQHIRLTGYVLNSIIASTMA